MSRLLILIIIALFMVSAALGWMLQTFLPGAPLAYVFVGLTPVLKLMAVLVVVVTGVGAFGALKRDRVRVRTATFVTVALGVLGAGYGELNTQLGTLSSNPVTFATMTPGRIESSAMLALGLLGALLGLGILQLRRGRV